MQIIQKYRLVFFVGIFILISSCQSKSSWDIREFGAVADSTTINTVAIQNAIDACSEAGGGMVIMKEGNYITGTILLKNNVILKIDEGAKLIGSKNPLDYKSIDPFTDAVGQLRGKCLVGAEDVSNIGIIGNGTIDGMGKHFLRENLLLNADKFGFEKSKVRKYQSNRPFLVRFVKSSNITVKDVHLRSAAAWALHFFQSNKINVDGIDIYNHNNHNTDGIDMDSSSDAVIKNCNIDTADDAICFKTTSPVPTQNILVENCRLKSNWGAVKFGTESMGDFKNITVKNCYLHNTKGGGIKVLSVDGANISDIVLDSLTMKNVDMPIFVRLGERLRTYRYAPKQKVGSINNISISNISAISRSIEESRVSPPSGIFITGTSNHKIGKVSLNNIKITLPGGGNEEHSKIVVAEDEKRYPEFSFFGVSPAYGIYARHINNLKTDNIKFTLLDDDQRKEIVFDDVN
ncbi:Polygalacturonase [Lutibacter oricola]|uniref:Polygalacturonase n=1 Tax=Lutibacter oricola TaxID=762486 RepID=A0A1H2SMV5_9FLAO|nr:glycosyl hydrolase family 28 protein [Lutibacter oricola]SDW32847.1 Polygalacturonase [Lutibacter oricola]